MIAAIISDWVWPLKANQRSALICIWPMRDIDMSAGLIPMSMFMWSRNWFLLATRNPPCESSSGLAGVRSHSSGSFLWRTLVILMVIRNPVMMILALFSRGGNQNWLTNYLRRVCVHCTPMAWLAGLDESSSLSSAGSGTGKDRCRCGVRGH